MCIRDRSLFFEDIVRLYTSSHEGHAPKKILSQGVEQVTRPLIYPIKFAGSDLPTGKQNNLWRWIGILFQHVKVDRGLLFKA